MAALLGLDIDDRARDRRGGGRRPGLRRRERQRPGTDRRQRPSRGGRARRRAGRGAGRAAVDHAAGQRPVSLAADGARPPRSWPRPWPKPRIEPPLVPLVANVTAAPTSDPAEIRELLVEQVTQMVRWRESVHAIRRRGGRGGRRDRRRAGARRPRQADRPHAAGDFGRHAGRGRSPRQAAGCDVRSDRTDRAGDRRLGRHRRRDRAGACTARGPRSRWPAPGQAALAALAEELGERAHVLAGRSRRPGGARPPAARGRGGDGPGRYPRQQRRDHPRQHRAAAARRGLAGGHRRQPDRRLPPDPRRVARHGPAPPRAGDLDHLGRRGHRQCRPGELCRGQGRR